VIEHPISPAEGACAVIARDEHKRYGDQCAQPPAWRARWTFDYPRRRAAAILLCDAHRGDLDGNPRLTSVRAL
jgi:hypothetical protein